MKRKIIHIVWALIFAAPLAASAQMDDGMMMGPGGMGMMGGGQEMHGMMGPGMMDHGMGMEMGGMMRMMDVLADLDLTPDQKKKIQALKISHQKEAIPLFSKIRMTGLEIEELLQADTVDLKKVEAKVREKHDTLVKLDMSHYAVKEQVRAILTPEQREKMDSMMMDMMGGMRSKMPMMPMMPMMHGPGGGMRP